MSLGRSWCEDCQRLTSGVCMNHLNVTIGPPVHAHRFVPYPQGHGFVETLPTYRRIYCETCGEVRPLDAGLRASGGTEGGAAMTDEPGLRAALGRYGRHEQGCTVFMPADSGCNCGWTDLRAALAATPAASDGSLRVEGVRLCPCDSDSGGPEETCPMCGHMSHEEVRCDSAMIVLAAGDGSLDVAWREAEAALPEGDVIEFGNKPDGTYWAHRIRRDHDHAEGFQPYVDGPTPAAALRELAARLTELEQDGR